MPEYREWKEARAAIHEAMAAHPQGYIQALHSNTELSEALATHHGGLNAAIRRARNELEPKPLPDDVRRKLAGWCARKGRPPWRNELSRARDGTKAVLDTSKHGTVEEVWRQMGWGIPAEARRLESREAFIAAVHEVIQQTHSLPTPATLEARFPQVIVAAELYHGGWFAAKRRYAEEIRKGMPVNQRPRDPRYDLPLEVHAAAREGNPEAISQVIASVEKLIHKEANRCLVWAKSRRPPPHPTHKDLVYAATVELTSRMIGEWPYDPNFSFSTYATPIVREAVKTAAAEHGSLIHVPARISEDLYRFDKARKQLAVKLGREPKQSEILEELGWNADYLEDLQLARNAHSTIQLDAPAKSGEPNPSTLLELTEDPVALDPARLVVNAERQMIINEALNSLNSKERQVIELAHGLNGNPEHSRSEVARMMDLSRQRIKQIEEAAIRKLRRNTRLRDII